MNPLADQASQRCLPLPLSSLTTYHKQGAGLLLLSSNSRLLEHRNRNHPRLEHRKSLVEVGLDAGHVLDEVHHTVAVAPLVVVPGHQLHEFVAQGNACLSVEDA